MDSANLIQIWSVLMVISGHNLGLQTGNIDLVRDGHNHKNINLKIKKNLTMCTLIYLSTTPYIFLYVSNILTGQEVKNLSGGGLFWSSLKNDF